MSGAVCGGVSEDGWDVRERLMFNVLGMQRSIGRGTGFGDQTGRWTDVKCHGGESEGWKNWGSIRGFPLVKVR